MFVNTFFRVEPSYNRKGELVTTKVHGYDLSASGVRMLDLDGYAPILEKFGGWFNKKSRCISIPAEVSRLELANWLEFYYGGEGDNPNGQLNAVYVGI
ncbi:MAG: hypothetical protein J6N51_10895 [Selenomonas sp.]|nr:hypothetical protein [Selenomonas sp.]MBP3730981.1 hypothetical protein [Mailhella sp.]